MGLDGRNRRNNARACSLAGAHRTTSPESRRQIAEVTNGRVAPGVATRGSHRSGRAHISASGSSDAGFAIQPKRCMPGLLSWVVTVIRGSKYEASDVFLGPGSNARHPLSVFPSLHRVLRDQFPGFISTMRVLRLPAAHPAALRCRRLAVPRLHSLRSFLDGRVRRQGLELVTRYLRPGCCRGNDRISQVPGEPQLSVCTCSNPTPAGLLAPDHTVQQRGPWSSKGRGSHDWVFRRSIAWLSDSLSTLVCWFYLQSC